jgi:hypothetical protein
MTAPDPTDLIRLLSGESVFDLDTDSKILQAANEVSGRAMFELFKRCDTSVPNWEQDFAGGLLEISTGDPGSLIGFDDGRWQGLESGGEYSPDDTTDKSQEYYLKLEFADAEACFYQFHLFPTFEEPFFQEVSRKRADEYQYLRIRIAHPKDLQVFIRNLRRNPHFVKVHDSAAHEFDEAPSQNPG